MQFILGILKYLWALPNTIIGMVIGVLSLLTGGSAIRTGAVFEFHDGFATWFLKNVTKSGILAMTLGYTILGKDRIALDDARDHEMIHVAQYGRWGPFFLPAYLISSIAQQIKGRDAYRDNMFEREAYANSVIRRTPRDQSSDV